MTSRYVAELAAELLMVGFPGKAGSEHLERMVQRGVRSFALFARNAGDAAEVRHLTAQLRRLAGGDLIVAVDQEGGSVTRLQRAAARWPGAMACAATHDLDLIERVAATSAAQLRDLGINLNFAPVADVMTDFRNPVLGTRVFSDDPEMTARCVAAVVRGQRRAGIGSTAKHFPGHGATPTDSHLDLPVVDRTLEELRAIDLVPFASGVREGVECMMISHVWCRSFESSPTPATMSRRVVDLARSELGFDGVILTDCLEMAAIQSRMSTAEAVVGAVAAGCDVPIVSHRLDRQEQGLDGLIAAVEGGEVPLSRLEDAARRVRGLRGRLQPPGGAVDPEVQVHDVTARSLTLLRDRERCIPLHLSPEDGLAIISFSTRATGAEGAPMEQRVKAIAHHYHPNVAHLVVTDDDEGGSGDKERASGIEAAAGCAASSAVTVVLTAFSTGRAIQAETVRRIAALGKPLIVIATRDPYDLLQFSQIPCYVAVYGEDERSLDAGLALVFGRLGAVGRLPVALPGLYPRGYGLMRSGG